VQTRHTNSRIQTSESVARVLDRPFGLCMRGILKRKDQGQDLCRLKTDLRICGVEGSPENGAVESMQQIFYVGRLFGVDSLGGKTISQSQIWARVHKALHETVLWCL
jgi:hypothetical protein